MATYGVYSNNGSVDTEIVTEEISDDLRGDEIIMRIQQLFDSVVPGDLPDGSTWCIQVTGQQRT